ncbi:DUF262 domain-containing protein [Mycoplasma putrefaciens]|uniref:DUF262 domain-containing protein n=1 Tax=Mycoplasma putrefaciens (strain ATCC 15718 / NCTC 10155 / C30 KS-1 / KS-1) TaxID=743965 RepID=A0A7U3ZRY4_MYCPK|nr:DUF262 domain-containing protein [Mycoplasma putrefaciens]AEM68420.1 uncharacterized protein MPUT_0012 [Mycoplasma putrefaciens KS1]
MIQQVIEDPIRQSLDDFFTMKEKCFYIPIFQRRYTWTTKHIERLLEDITSVLIQKDKEYFLGVIFYLQEPKYDRKYHQVQIIDGQQRITSLFLILHAIKKLIDEEKINNIALNETIIKYLKVTNKDNQITSKNMLFHKTSDDEVYKKISDERLEIIEQAEKDTNTYKNFESVYKQIKELRKKYSWEELLSIFKKINIVSISIQSADDAQIIFQKINSTGVRLYTFDLVKNFLLMKLKDNDDQEKFNRNLKWSVEDKLNNDYNHIHELLKLFLAIKKDAYKYDNIDNIYNAFVDWFKKEQEKNQIKKIEDFTNEVLTQISDYAIYYSQIKIKDKKEREFSNELWELISEFRNIKINAPLVLIIEMFRLWQKDKVLQEAQVIRALKFINSLLMRRDFCDKSTNRLSKFFLRVLRDVKRSSSDYFDFEKRLLKLLVEEPDMIPNDEQVRRLMHGINAYSKNLRVFLNKIEIDNPSQPNLDILSIEHLMPQTLNEKWIKDLNVEGLSEAELDRKHKEYLNKIGNLTLVTSKINSSISNREWKYKKEKIEDKLFGLSLTKDIKENEIWGFAQIDERTNKLIEEFIKYFKYPSLI